MMKNSIKKILKEFINESEQRFFLVKFKPKDDFEPGTAIMDQHDWVNFIDNIHDGGGSIKSLSQDEYINLSGKLTDKDTEEIEDISEIFGEDYEAIFLLKQFMKKHEHEIEFPYENMEGLDHLMVVSFKYDEKLYSFLDRTFKLWNKHNQTHDVVERYKDEIWVTVPHTWTRFIT
jgi:hypothetical protein